MKKRLKAYLRPFANPKFLLCFLIPWLITNGIWYIGVFLGSIFGISWLSYVCGVYIAWLYTPWACEKILILPVALWLARKLFKNDAKTQAQIQEMLTQARKDWESIKSKIRRKHK
jgi:hypothetical protein